MLADKAILEEQSGWQRDASSAWTPSSERASGLKRARHS